MWAGGVETRHINKCEMTTLINPGPLIISIFTPSSDTTAVDDDLGVD